MYEKLLTTPYKFSKPKNSRGLYYELSHNVYYVRMMAKRRPYNDLELISASDFTKQTLSKMRMQNLIKAKMFVRDVLSLKAWDASGYRLGFINEANSLSE